MGDEPHAALRPNRVPFYVGLGAGLVAIALSVFGMVRNTGLASLNPVSLLLVIVIAGGSWGLVAWAITTAVYDVEADVADGVGGAQEQSAAPPADK